MATPRDLYAELGVARDAKPDDIRKAYRKLARQFHPDVNAKKDAEERFKAINAAYEVLGSPEKRAAYDEFGEDSLRTGFDAKAARGFKEAYERQQSGSANPFAGFGGAGGFGGFGGAGGDAFGGGGFAFDPEDLMNGILGRKRNVQRRGPLRAVVDITLGEAIRGTQVSLAWKGSSACGRCGGSGSADGNAPTKCIKCKGTGRTESGGRVRMTSTCEACGGTGWTRVACPACAGAGQVEAQETLAVRIPRGADNGSRLRVPRPDGQELVLETRVKDHPYFRRQGLDLYVRLPLTLDEAYNGGRVRVPTVDGTVEMTVPARTQNGTKLRLRGKGVEKGNRRGDLFVEADVRLPEGEDPALSAAVRAASAGYSKDVRADVKL
jgi:molecular chaperone DnaJ